jgi:anthranilate synthase component 2
VRAFFYPKNEINRGPLFVILPLKPTFKMRILVLDNHDSFVFNLVHYLEAFGHEIIVIRPGFVSEIDISLYDKIVLSPGPGLPNEIPELIKAIELWHNIKPILGVCLGHQALGLFFGAQLENLAQVTHGVSTPINILNPQDKLFKNLPNRIEVARYHSWCIANKSLPQEFEVTAIDDNKVVMAIRHKTLPIHGIQFHPESILTPLGRKIIKNWLEA